MFLRPGPIMMRKFIHAAALVLLFGASVLTVVSPALAAVVSSIVVEGNDRVDDDTVRAYLTIQPGVSYGAGEVDSSIDALYQTGLFADVSINQRGSTLVVRVSENAVINRVSFEGNRRVSDEMFSRSRSQSKRAVGLQQGAGPAGRAAHPGGLPSARPLPRRGRAADHRPWPEAASISCSTSPRVPRPRSTRITFIGNSSFSDSRLRDEIKTKESGRILGFLRSTDLYDPDRLVADQETAAAVLLQPRLRRFPHPVGDGGLRPRAQRLLHHLHHGRGRPVPVRLRPGGHDARRSRSRAARPAGSIRAPAGATRPRTSNPPSRT